MDKGGSDSKAKRMYGKTKERKEESRTARRQMDKKYTSICEYCGQDADGELGLHILIFHPETLNSYRDAVKEEERRENGK